MKFAVICLCLLLTTLQASRAQPASLTSWDSYVPRTLESIIENNQPLAAELEADSPSSKNLVLLTANSFQSKVKLVFLGQSRQLTAEHSKLLGYWGKMLKINDDLGTVFATEMLFREGTKDYWIPVQKPLLNFLPQEVKPGESFTGYIVWIGSMKTGGQWDSLFAMNGFDAPASKSTQ